MRSTSHRSIASLCYANRMRSKYRAKWGLQVTRMIFRTRSKNY
ncbi:MAG: DUF6783 domain-containing protein [Blautia sp.]